MNISGEISTGRMLHSLHFCAPLLKSILSDFCLFFIPFCLNFLIFSMPFSLTMWYLCLLIVFLSTHTTPTALYSGHRRRCCCRCHTTLGCKIAASVTPMATLTALIAPMFASSATLNTDCTSAGPIFWWPHFFLLPLSSPDLSFITAPSTYSSSVMDLLHRNLTVSLEGASARFFLHRKSAVADSLSTPPL